MRCLREDGACRADPVIGDCTGYDNLSDMYSQYGVSECVWAIKTQAKQADKLKP